MTMERIWAEVDGVTDPVKLAVNDLESRGRLQLTDPVSQFCTSYVLVNVCDVGLQSLIDTWNSHPISGTVQETFAYALSVDIAICRKWPQWRNT